MAFGLEDPAKQRAFLIGILLVGLGYVFYQYLWKPIHEERVATEERLAQLERYNGQARALTQPQRVNELRRQEAEYQIALAAYETMLPSEAEVAGLLGDVAAAATQNGIAIVNFAPLEPLTGEQLLELPYDVQVQGGYHDIGRFLAELANLPRLVRPSVTAMEQVVIQEEAPAGGGATPREPPPPQYEVLGTLRLSTFVPLDEVQTVGAESGPPQPTGSSALGPEGSDAS